MTDSVDQPVKQHGLGVAFDGEPGTAGDKGKGALEALDRLARRVEGLKDVLAREKARVQELEQRLAGAEKTAKTRGDKAREKKLARLEILERESKEWDNEREEVVRIVEGLIRKVAALEKQM